jgi:hypothetical protein
MTTADVQAAVERIRSLAHDDESAHVEEDNLYVSVLQAIADGTAEDPAGMAALALEATDIKFSRWYA